MILRAPSLQKNSEVFMVKEGSRKPETKRPDRGRQYRSQGEGILAIEADIKTWPCALSLI